MQLEITDSEYSDFEGSVRPEVTIFVAFHDQLIWLFYLSTGFDKFLEEDRSIEDNQKDNGGNLVTTQSSDTDEKVMEKKQSKPVGKLFPVAMFGPCIGQYGDVCQCYIWYL